MRDDDVVRQAKQGEPDAWRTLYRLHAGRLVVWLRAMPSGDVAATPEDLAAEAWLTAARRIAEFRGGSDDFGGWLFGIARHLSANARRRSARRRTDPVAVVAVEPDLPPDQVVVDSSSWVTWALGQLPEREREVLACMEVVDLDTAATASALGLTKSAVRVARHRGLRRLRALAGGPAVEAARQWS